MGVRDEVLVAIHQHTTPGDIARQRGVTVDTILDYLDQLVGSGRLRRSDILFSVPADLRHAIERELASHQDTANAIIVRRVLKSGFVAEAEHVMVVRKYGNAKHSLGEVYEDIRSIEVGLHQQIRALLAAEFGPEEEGWWRRGVPLSIRVECQKRREEDNQWPVPEPYRYTDLIDLSVILDKQWSILGSHLPEEVSKDKKALLTQLNRLNQIRRGVMHPVRGNIPSEDDFEFLRNLRRDLGFQ